MIKRILIAGVSAFLTCAMLAGQSIDATMSSMTPEEILQARIKAHHKVVFVGDGEEVNVDSVRHMIDMFYIDQFYNFQDPQAPYFLLMSRDANLAMGIGGAVRMRGWADFDGAVASNDFNPYLIPVPATPVSRHRIGGTPGGSSLFFRVIGFNPLVKNFNAYIQCDFSGNNNNMGFRLKKAYVSVQDWTVGYATTTFADPMAEVPTIDGAGPNGKASHTAMLVRWYHSFNTHWSMAASMEMPSSRIDADGTVTERLNDYMPDYAAFGQYEWSHNQHLRLGALVRLLPYRDLISGVNRSVVGWGLQVSGVVRPCYRVALYGEVNTGKGYSSYMNDLSIDSYDLIASADADGRMCAPHTLGIACGMKYNFLYNLYACAAYGQAQFFNNYSSMSKSDYKLGRYAAVNLFWEPTERLQIGVEYIWGQRINFDFSHGHANRIDALFQFSF